MHGQINKLHTSFHPAEHQCCTRSHIGLISLMIVVMLCRKISCNHSLLTCISSCVCELIITTRTGKATSTLRIVGLHLFLFRLVTTLYGMSVVDMHRWDWNKQSGDKLFNWIHGVEERPDFLMVRSTANLLVKGLHQGNMQYYDTENPNPTILLQVRWQPRQ
jgi:hypothetical protein